MNDDYVKRSDVHKAFQPKYAPAINRTFAAMIDSVPAADVVERKTAKWRYQVMTVPGGKGQTYANWSCSRCRKKEKKRSPYCPNCGAEMENYDG